VVGLGAPVRHPGRPSGRRGEQQWLPLLRHRRHGRHALPLQRLGLDEDCRQRQDELAEARRGLPPRKHLQIRIRIAGYSSSGTARIRFNGDNGNNYSDTRQDGNSAPVSQTNQSGIRVAATETSSPRGIIVFDVINEATRAKSAIGRGHSTSESASIAPIINQSAGVWANTTAAIDTVTLNVGGGGGNLLAGTEVTVFGSD
jgi:hypothetical protein